MPRHTEIYLCDILEAIKKIEHYTKNLSSKKFSRNSLVIDAVVRNLEIIGEAVKKIPPDVKREHPSVEWRKFAGLRDILIHEYFGINLEIVWDICVHKLPSLKVSVQGILKESRDMSRK